MKRLPQFTGFDHCQTPPDVYAALDKEFEFDCDPCPLTPRFDGLLPDWAWGKKTYVNPPYSNSDPWVERAIEEMQKGNLVVMLLKADTSTKRFHELILPHADEIRFLKGRLHFPPYGKPAPFASMIVVFRPGLREPHVCECPEKKCSFCHN